MSGTDSHGLSYPTALPSQARVGRRQIFSGAKINHFLKMMQEELLGKF
jgi:hypothetical protein